MNLKTVKYFKIDKYRNILLTTIYQLCFNKNPIHNKSWYCFLHAVIDKI